MIEIIPTCVPSRSDELSDCAQVARKFASSLHIDIDDGVFATHRTWPYAENGRFEDVTLPDLHGLAPEAHLMTLEPRALGEAFARAGAARVVGHVEGFADNREIYAALASWRALGAEVGLGLLFHTPLDVVAPYVAECDTVHLMTIATIGTQGIPYEKSAPVRIAEFHARFPGALISVDGGVSESNIEDLARAGARRFGVGSAIFRADDPAGAYRRLKSLAENALE
ncbi:MAG: hypothetical protein RLZZ416_735 [Candidatus Parcubacteria bacterium]